MSFKVQVDWAKNGTFSETGIDNVTDLVRPKHGAMVVEYGRDQSTALAPTVAGRGSLVLTNRDRRFSPRNSSSPLYGLVKPARPVRIIRSFVTGVGPTPSETLFPSATLFPSGTENIYILFVGHTDDNPINPDLDSKTVSLSMVDSLADFRGQSISTEVYTGIRTGEAINKILDACNWPAGLRDINPGATIISYWWEDNTDAFTALEKLVRSEGPPAMLTIAPDGSIVFKDRHHRLFDPGSLTSQQTWRDNTTEPIMQGFTYDEAWRNIINTGTATVEIRQQGPSRQQVWQNESTITLAAGEQRIITVTATDPFTDAIIPQVGDDYTVVTGAVTMALTRTSGASAGIIITAPSVASTIEGLQLRAAPIPVTHSIQVNVADAVSVDDYGSRSFPSDLPWCNQYDAEAVMATAVEFRAQPLPIVQAEFQIATPAKAEMLLDRDLSDLVTVYETETELDGDNFFVESITHEVMGDFDHRIIFGIEAAPELTITPDSILILDSAVVGHRLGEGVLAA